MVITLDKRRWIVALIMTYPSTSFSGFANKKNKTPELNLPEFHLTMDLDKYEMLVIGNNKDSGFKDIAQVL